MPLLVHGEHVRLDVRVALALTKVPGAHVRTSRHPGELCRLWDFFLAWSVIASGQCSATCYQLLAHKNTYEFPRDRFCDKAAVGLHEGTRGRVDPPGGEVPFETPLQGDRARTGELV